MEVRAKQNNTHTTSEAEAKLHQIRQQQTLTDDNWQVARSLLMDHAGEKRFGEHAIKFEGVFGESWWIGLGGA